MLSRLDELTIIIYELQSRLKMTQGIDKFTQSEINNKLEILENLQSALNEYYKL